MFENLDKRKLPSSANEASGESPAYRLRGVGKGGDE